MLFDLKVLVVDDMTSSRLMLERMLTRLGFHDVEAAQCGDEALHCLCNSAFDAVLSDLHMPGMDGLALLGQIRATPAISKTEFALITGDDGAAIAPLCATLQVRSILHKPLRMDHLMNTLITIKQAVDLVAVPTAPPHSAVFDHLDNLEAIEEHCLA